MHVTAVKTIATEKADDEGYITYEFTDSTSFGINAQPYSSKMAQEDYGLQADNIRYQCFSHEPIPMEEGEFIRLDAIYRIVLAHEWEGHTEFILQDAEGIEADG